MWLSLSELEESDPLPDEGWAERVVAVIRANGRLSDDTFDAFDSWTERLADATHGAVYSHPSGRFTHVWADVDEGRTEARTRELIEAGDFAGLAGWIRELVAAGRRGVDAAEVQLRWIGEAAIPMLERCVAAADTGVGPAIAALHDVLGSGSGSARIDALVLAAAAVPGLVAERAVLTKAAGLRARQLRAEAAAVPLPADLAALQRLLDAALGGDPAAQARLDRFTGYEVEEVEVRQRLVFELAQSGRELPVLLSSRLVELVCYAPALQDRRARESFARHGSLARQIVATIEEREHRAQDNRRARSRVVAERTAEYDALYGRDRSRPRMPDDLLMLIRRGQLAAAVAAYRERFPKSARQAEQAVEDARAHFAPNTEPLK